MGGRTQRTPVTPAYALSVRILSNTDLPYVELDKKTISENDYNGKAKGKNCGKRK